MPKAAQVKGNEAFHRMNYLQQLANYIAPLNTELAAQYSELMKAIRQRTLTRWAPEVKHNFCKGCNAVLIPGDTQQLRLHRKKGQRVVRTCLRCGTIRRMGTRKGYRVWGDKDEANVST